MPDGEECATLGQALLCTQQTAHAQASYGPCAATQGRLHTHREQERRQKADDARRETERLLRNQQAELEAKKADMARRDVERDAARSAAAAEATLQNQAAKAKVPCQHKYPALVLGILKSQVGSVCRHQLISVVMWEMQQVPAGSLASGKHRHRQVCPTGACIVSN